MEAGKIEELDVETGESDAHSCSGNGAGDHGDKRDHQHEAQVVDADFAARVAERLERRDLLSLCVDHAGEHNIEEESGYAQENCGDHQGHALEFIQLILEELVGDLVISVVGAEATVALGELVYAVNHLFAVCAGHQAEREIIERAFHIECALHLFPVHPEDTVAQVVREHSARRDEVGVLG